MNLYECLFCITFILHVTLILFNLFGFFISNKFPSLKLFHCGSLTVSALIMLSGHICPLTVLEQKLRQLSDPSTILRQGFIAHHIAKWTSIQIPPWLLTVVATLLALASIWIYYGQYIFKERDIYYDRVKSEPR